MYWQVRFGHNSILSKYVTHVRWCEYTEKILKTAVKQPCVVSLVWCHLFQSSMTLEYSLCSINSLGTNSSLIWSKWFQCATLECSEHIQCCSYLLYMLSSKIKNAQWAENWPQRVVALEKQPQREILHCGSYSEKSEGFRLKVTCNLWAKRWPKLP